MWSSILPVIFVLVVIMIFRHVNTERKPPIYGVYQQKNKNYWFKFVLMYVVLNLKMLIRHIKRILAVERGQSEEGTCHIQKQDELLENVQELGDFPLAVDAVYFNGASRSGSAVVVNVARRQKGRCDAFLLLKLEDQELLLLPSVPDTSLQQTPDEEGTYQVAGISCKMVMPMRAWTVHYDGLMKSKKDPENKVPVKLALTWSAVFQHFDYENLSPLSMSKDLAREQWTKQFFKLLGESQQHVYEQQGSIQGTATVDGKEYKIDMQCVRDHSFGKSRDWRNIHRYVFHLIFLENGDALTVGALSQPLTLSHLSVGYYCRFSDQRVFPIDDSTYQLHQHAENQTLPKDYGFIFKSDGKDFEVKVVVNHEQELYIGSEKEGKMYERWCTVDVNGVKGAACVEWYYNNQKTMLEQ